MLDPGLTRRVQQNQSAPKGHYSQVLWRRYYPQNEAVGEAEGGKEKDEVGRWWCPAASGSLLLAVERCLERREQQGQQQKEVDPERKKSYIISLGKYRIEFMIFRRVFGASGSRSWSSSSHYGHPRVLRPIAFSLAVAGLSFGVLAKYRSETRWDVHGKRPSLWSDPFRRLRERVLQPPPPLIEERPFVVKFLDDLKDILIIKFKTQTDAQKLVNGLILLNGLVFAAWQVPAFSRYMTRYWAHDPLSGRSFTLLTSTFSHQSFLHFGFNMYALSGFLPNLMHGSGMGWEQTLALYLSAGVGASLCSHLITTALWKRGLRDSIPSIGASGGLWAILTAFAMVQPNAGVGLVFLPGLSFTMSELIPGMILLDCVGLLRGWRSFDHAAHLGGALCGYMYITYGRRLWAECQGALRRARHEKQQDAERKRK